MQRALKSMCNEKVNIAVEHWFCSISRLVSIKLSVSMLLDCDNYRRTRMTNKTLRASCETCFESLVSDMRVFHIAQAARRITSGRTYSYGGSCDTRDS